MNITHITWGLSSGGVETMLVDIVNEQAKSDNISIIVINDLIDNNLLSEISPQVKLFRCGRRIHSYNPIPFIKLNFFLWKSHPDIIHIQMSGFVRTLFSCKKVPKILTVHNTHNQITDYKFYDELCSISNGVKNVTKSQGFDSRVVYNGIHTERIKYKNAKKRNEVISILQVGRLEEIKGQHILLKAAMILKEKKIKFHIDFIGEGSNRKQIEHYIDINNLSNEISLLGLKKRSYIYDHLCNYDLFVQPSISEGFGLTLAEAIVAGIPVITSNLEGPMEIIAQGKFGDYFNVADYYQLAEKIINYINDDYVCNLENARKFVIHNFDIKTTVAQYKLIYRSILNEQ